MKITFASYLRDNQRALQRLRASKVAALEAEISSAHIEHRTSVMDRIDPAPWEAEIQRLENELKQLTSNT